MKTEVEKLATININRSEIARATGINLAHISRIFAGKSKPSIDLAIKIADHLNITLDQLCTLLKLSELD